MHYEADMFIGLAKSVLVYDLPPGYRVLEFGSHNVNGSPRKHFGDAAEYIGVDPWQGDGVDIVSKAQDYDGEFSFDLVISAETLEHDDNPAGHIESAWKALKPGGYLLITAAAPHRQPHRCDGATENLNGEYYENVTSTNLIKWLEQFEIVYLEHNRKIGDIRAVARKP